MNKFIGTGRLVKDPEVRYTQSQMCVANFTLAVNRPYKKGEDQKADFFRCVAFGKIGEFVEKNFRKGMKADIVGHINNEEYEKNGQKAYSTQITIESIEFGESKRAGDEQTATPPKADDVDQFVQADEEELPFSFFTNN